MGTPLLQRIKAQFWDKKPKKNNDLAYLAQKSRVTRNRMIAAGAAATSASVLTTAITTEALPTLGWEYMHANFIQNNRDAPIPETAIIMVHNAGARVGEGTPFFISNSNISMEDALRAGLGFEFDLWEEQGEIVVRHGPFEDPFSPSAVSLEDRLRPIADWLEQPGHQSQVVVIQLEDNLSDRYWDDAIFKEIFGDKLYTPADHSWGEWPSANELTANGQQVIILSDNYAISHDVGFSIHSHREFSQVWEDRSLTGVAGYKLHPEIAEQIDTAQFDQLVEGGGIIKIDAAGVNDPRLFSPEARGELAYRPDISLGGTNDGLVYLGDHDDLNKMFFVGGVGLSVAGGVFGILATLYSLYNDRQFFKHLKLHVQGAIDQLALEDFAKHKKVMNASRIEDKVLRRLINAQTKKVLITGSVSVLSLAGGFFGLGLLFPPIFPVFSGLAVATLAIGLGVTIIAGVWQRSRAKNNIKKILNEQDIKDKIAAKEQSLNKEVVGSDELLKNVKRTQNTSLLNRIALGLFTTSIVLRISNMAKYTLPAVGVVGGVALSSVYAVWAFVSSVVNYRERAHRYKRISKNLMSAIRPNIYRKPYLFWGRSVLDKFVEENPDQITATLKALSYQDNDLEHVKKRMMKDEKLRHALELMIKRETLLNRLHIIFEKEAWEEHWEEASQDPKVIKHLLEAYAIDKVSRSAARDVRLAGIGNSFKLMIAFGSVGMIFPPVTVPFLALAVGTFLIGTVVSLVLAWREKKRFEGRAREELGGQAIMDNFAQHESANSTVSEYQLQSDNTQASRALETDGLLSPDELSAPRYQVSRLFSDIAKLLSEPLDSGKSVSADVPRRAILPPANRVNARQVFSQQVAAHSHDKTSDPGSIIFRQAHKP